MDDTISRQAAIDEIRKCRFVVDAIEKIRALPSAQQWIPVTERLPEDNTEVWVTTDMLFEVTRARWHKDKNLWCHPHNSDCVLALRPIAWMEIFMPKPYKGECDG